MLGSKKVRLTITSHEIKTSKLTTTTTTTKKKKKNIQLN